MFEYYENRLCVAANWLFGEGSVMSKDNYDKLRKTEQIRRLRANAPGQPALIEYSSLPERFKRKVEELVGDPHKQARRASFADQVLWDAKAFAWFSDYRKASGGGLTELKAREYTWNASVLNAVGRMVDDTRSRRRGIGARGMGQVWELAAQSVAALPQTEYPHSLPLNPRRLADKYKAYAADGYASLVHRAEGNQNARVVTPQLELLLISLYCMENRPFASRVRDMYLQFLGGGVEVVDTETGELYDRNDFMRDGQPVEVSEATVWNVLNATKNQAIIARRTASTIDYNTLYRPHNMRHRPQYSLSKISMDDREIPEMGTNGLRQRSYLVYDPMSEVILAAVYGPEVNTEMVFACLRDLYHTVREHQLVWPGEVEVEQHLMRPLMPILEAMFPAVRLCNPANSREKRAEHGIRSLKYGAEKDRADRGRFYGRGRYKLPQEKVAGETKERKYLPEEIVANNRRDVYNHNHALHSNQKQFPGRTRWQVMLEHQNPNLAPPVEHVLARYLGLSTDTTIRNRDYVRVQYANYRIENFDMLALLRPNQYGVTAYWIPGTQAEIPQVWLYQGEQYLGRAHKAERYNEALAERSPDDERIRAEQAKRQAEYDRLTREGVAAKVRKVKVLPATKALPAEVVTVPAPPERANMDLAYLMNNDFDNSAQLAEDF